MNSITTNYSLIQVQDIVDDLKRKYTAAIEEPIIDAKEIKPDTETIRLRFPKIVDAFIPQSYKCLSYEHKETHLENEEVWKNLPIQHDLDKFFLKYLYSPDSIEYPLLILGHPGSGKSLLTKVLAAQLMSSSYTVIRIPLREVNAEAGIDILVEDQIKKLTNRPLSQGYGGFATQFSEKPLIIILDGYDELLQAKGDVFSGYLEKARIFQQDQKAMKRPIRIIITSRITLIDKARVPINSTILRLMEFDQQQRQTWINIWNNINSEYFANSDIKPFSLPASENGKKNNLIELAEQPLLLLMLALYDSEANELARTSNIKRTELYDNLLRRFVRRERGRYVPGFGDKPAKEQEAIIDQEMNRLGVVAIGMYNRQEVVIRSKQLERDLDIFQAHRVDGSPDSHTLQESESVLGGFFFIHKSTARDVDAHSDNSESAYEFLHNTFGEFLAADFILRNTISEVRDIYVDRTFKPTSFENKLSNPDTFNSGWFYCLMFVPLYSRPVVIEMLREHAKKALQRALQIYNAPINITQDDFVSNLKFIVQNQLKMILNTRNSPGVMRNGILFDRDIPLLGYLSTYSLNLIILVCALNPDGFEFNEDEYHNSEVSELASKPWDKLTALWKAWFSFADLVGLSVILRAKRKSDTTVLVVCNEKFESTRYEQPIDILLCVSSTLADNLLTGLSGLQTQRFNEITRMDVKDICEILEGESADLYFSYLVALLRREINELSYKSGVVKVNYCKVNDMIIAIIKNDRIRNVNQDTLLNFLEVFECCLQRNMVFSSTRRELINSLPHLIDMKVNLKKDFELPEVAACVQLLQRLITNTDLSILGNDMIYNNPFSRNIFIDAEWSKDVDRIMYYSSRYAKNERRLIQRFKYNNAYQIPFLDIIENSPMMDAKNCTRVLRQFVELDNVRILLETNPELLSRAILILLKNDVLKQSINNKTIDMFLRGCLEQLSSVGIGYFGFNAIINVISIAHYVQARPFLGEISNLLQRKLFGKHSSSFAYIVYLYPAFVTKLIEVMPEIFTDDFLYTFEPFSFREKGQYIRPEKLLDYIKLLRCLYQLINGKSSFSLKMYDALHQFAHVIHESRGLKKSNLNQLTVSQIDDLIWYADFADDERLSSEIKEVLRHFSVNTPPQDGHVDRSNQTP